MAIFGNWMDVRLLLLSAADLSDVSGLDVYDAAILSVLILLGLNALLNVGTFPSVRRRRFRASLDREAPTVSVLVPARNEAHQIELCLESLKTQTYNDLEVIVLDDCSEDGTADVVKELGFSESEAARYRLVRGEPLPAEWTGKSWACHQLGRKASGKYLLFTDADTVHHESSVESAVTMAVKTRAHLLSVWPHQITLTWFEKLIIPMIYFLIFAFIPLWFLRVTRAMPRSFKWMPQGFWERTGVANGQFLLFAREAYEHLGGHACVKQQLVEDVALAREVLKRVPQGWRLVNADGHSIVECRMYRGFGDVWEGFSKNLRPVFGRRTFDFLGAGLLLAMAGILPFFFFLAREHPWLVVLQIEMLVLIRLLLTFRFRTSWLSLLLHPLALLLTLSIGLNSWWIARTGKIFWKRRSYDWKGVPETAGHGPLDDLDR